MTLKPGWSDGLMRWSAYLTDDFQIQLGIRLFDSAIIVLSTTLIS